MTLSGSRAVRLTAKGTKRVIWSSEIGSVEDALEPPDEEGRD